MKLIGYFINAITAIGMFIYLIKKTYYNLQKGYMGEIGPAFVIFIIFIFCWVLIPYILMSFIIARHSKANPEWVMGDSITSLMVCLFGLLVWADVFYIRPDPQSPVALFFLPPIQVVIFLGITAIFRAIESRR